MKSVFEKMLEREKQAVFKFSLKHNVPYDKLLDFLKDNQIKE